MGKEEDMLKKRLLELSDLAYLRGRVVFSDFLNLNELNILHTIPKHMFPAGYQTYGGYGLSERQMAAFLPDALSYDYSYPIKVIEVAPVNKRFAETLTHRDYLGALMNLGVRREKLGDIAVDAKRAFLFVSGQIAGYIAENLTRVRRTEVRAETRECMDISYTPSYEEIKGIVPSVRLDTVLAAAWPLSRSKMAALIGGGKVFVNGKLTMSSGCAVKDGDIISARGLGRIVYDGVVSETKKGRSVVSLRKYI